MTEAFVYTVVGVLATVFGAIAGRVLAVEADHRLAAIFGGTYVGAGAGLMSAIPSGSVLALVAQYLDAGSKWFDALNVAAIAVLWGTACGAAGGLAISTVVAALNLGARRSS